MNIVTVGVDNGFGNDADWRNNESDADKHKRGIIALIAHLEKAIREKPTQETCTLIQQTIQACQYELDNHEKLYAQFYI